jgi:hypothetical protein
MSDQEAPKKLEMKIYRYLEKQYAEKFLEGKIRIPSAKAQEDHKDPERHDKETETHATEKLQNIYFDFSDGDPKIILDTDGKTQHETGQIKAEAGPMRYTYTSPDYYLLSFASQELEEDIIETFQTDGLVVVHDIGIFAQRLVDSTEGKMPDGDWVGKMTYVKYYDECDSEHPKDTDIYFTKSNKYKRQFEFRLVLWRIEPKEKELPKYLNLDLGSLNDIAHLKPSD